MVPYAVAGFLLIVGASFVRGAKDKYQDFCVGAAIPIAVLLLLPFGYVTGLLCPRTLDATLRQIDLALHLDGFAMTSWLIRRGWYFWVAPVYYSLPLVMAVAWCLERSRVLLRVAAVGPLLALPFYLLVPAAGPEYAFHDFPQPDASAVAAATFHPRNCMPSMHVAWALLLFMNAQNRAWRILLLVYAALTSIATVAGGEHYFVDVIVAIPFAFGVQWFVDRFWAQIEGKVRRLNLGILPEASTKRVGQGMTPSTKGDGFPGPGQAIARE